MCGSRGRVVNIMTSENTNSAGSSAAHIKSVESLDQSNEMERGLKNRHVQFIAIGGTIGTGLFLGSGKSIALTGPSIIFVYIGVGLIMFLLMRAIGEMMYSDPSQHTFINFHELRSMPNVPKNVTKYVLTAVISVMPVRMSTIQYVQPANLPHPRPR